MAEGERDQAQSAQAAAERAKGVAEGERDQAQSAQAAAERATAELQALLDVMAPPRNGSIWEILRSPAVLAALGQHSSGRWRAEILVVYARVGARRAKAAGVRFSRLCSERSLFSHSRLLQARLDFLRESLDARTVANVTSLDENQLVALIVYLFDFRSKKLHEGLDVPFATQSRREDNLFFKINQGMRERADDVRSTYFTLTWQGYIDYLIQVRSEIMTTALRASAFVSLFWHLALVSRSQAIEKLPFEYTGQVYRLMLNTETIEQLEARHLENTVIRWQGIASASKSPAGARKAVKGNKFDDVPSDQLLFYEIYVERARLVVGLSPFEDEEEVPLARASPHHALHSPHIVSMSCTRTGTAVAVARKRDEHDLLQERYAACHAHGATWRRLVAREPQYFPEQVYSPYMGLATSPFIASCG